MKCNFIAFEGSLLSIELVENANIILLLGCRRGRLSSGRKFLIERKIFKISLTRINIDSQRFASERNIVKTNLKFERELRKLKCTFNRIDLNRIAFCDQHFLCHNFSNLFFVYLSIQCEW